MRLYALHDKKARAFSSFHVERSDVVASRAFVDAVLQKDSQFAKYADDFELVSLCDVSQDYEKLADVIIQGSAITSIQFSVVISARQVLDSQPQLPLMLEA